MDRDDVVEAMIPASLKSARALTAYNAKGEAQPTQLTTDWDGTRRVLFRAKVPSVGAAVYYLRDELPPVPEKSPFSLKMKKTTKTIENERYTVIINTDGDLASIFDKQLKKELLEKPAQLQFIPNFPDRKPAWRIYPDDIAKPPRSVASDPIDIRIVENGPVRAAIEVVRHTENSKIVQRIRLYSGTDANRVEVANHIDWRTRGALFKAAFDLTASNPKATYNLELGTIERGNRTEKQYEVPTHGWIDLTDASDEFGVTLLTEHKYGSDKPDDNTLRLTLIHSPDTEPWDDETRDNGRTREMRWQDWGRHEFNYAITSHKGHWSNANPTREALRFEQPLTAFEVPKGSADKSTLSLMQISTPQINIQAIKMAENGSGVIVRLQEAHGKPCSGVELSAALPFTEAEETDGIERPLNINIPVKDQRIRLDFTRFECKTVLLKLPAPKAQSLTQPIELNYDCDVFSNNDNREDGYDNKRVLKARDDQTVGGSGSLDGKGNTYPAEMIGDTVLVGNVTFNIGPRDSYMANAIACRGQSIDVPEGTSVVHILAAADQDTDVIFQAGGVELPVTIGSWIGFIGQWDDRVFEGDVAKISYSIPNDLERIAPATIRNERIAWYASHRHMPYQDTYYDYGYLFAYRLEIPKGAQKLSLPDSPFVRIVAMSVGDENHAVALQSPFEDLHRDAAFDARFGALNIPEVNEDRKDKKSK
jgi:alpha-mannosidase